jgi:hypothetical protein
MVDATRLGRLTLATSVISEREITCNLLVTGSPQGTPPRKADDNDCGTAWTQRVLKALD